MHNTEYAAAHVNGIVHAIAVDAADLADAVCRKIIAQKGHSHGIRLADGAVREG